MKHARNGLPLVYAQCIKNDQFQVDGEKYIDKL